MQRPVPSSTAEVCPQRKPVAKITVIMSGLKGSKQSCCKCFTAS